MNQITKNYLKEISKADILSITLFFCGFLFAVTDMGILKFLGLVFSVVSTPKLVFIHLMFLLLLAFMVRSITKNINLFRIKKTTLASGKKMYIFIESFQLVSLAYFMGILTSVMNALVIEFFQRV